MEGILVSAPRFDRHRSGLGVSTPAPRISWTFSQNPSAPEEWSQQSYDIEVIFDNCPKSESFHVRSSESIFVPWPARPLKPREAAKIRVRCYGSSRNPSTQNETTKPTEWSSWATVEAGLLDQKWIAQWIAAPAQEKNEDGSLRPIRLTRTFEIPPNRDIRRARFYVTARGCYDASINGKSIGDQCMAPGWQSYTHRLHYQIFDLKELLNNSSSNEIAVTIGAGWFASALAWAGGRRCLFGDELSLLAQLVVDFEDESESFMLSTDSSWLSVQCPIASSELYNGETFDQGHDQSSQTSQSPPVRIVEFPTSKLISPDTPPVRVIEEVKVKEIIYSQSRKILIDFGQNLVGRLRIKSLRKAAGSRISFAHAEVLENGELGRRPLRQAMSTDTIICNGKELVNWTPKFTFHGFRYVEVSGWHPGDVECPLTPDSLVAQVLHTDMRRIGHFECSHDLVNKLHQNAVWSMRGNFLSLPTDCPQRDERLGWTGDIQVFAPSANFLYDTTGMLGNWLEDLAAEQLSPQRNGVPPFVVPDVITKTHARDDVYWSAIPNAVWDDVAVLLPWSLFGASGDLNILRQQYESMTSWLDRGVRRGPDRLWDPELYQLGDWLDPIAPPSEPGNGRTDGVLVADAYLVHVTKKVAEACQKLGFDEDGRRYSHDYANILGKFRAKYITATGLIVGDTQTALALGIVFGLFATTEQLRTAGERLARSVRMQQFRVATGFAGTPVILHALTKVKYHQLAYRMLLEKQCPSWMYAISMGATTIWERWDSMLPDGSINPGEMTSFNHYALGSVVNWLHECVGGISPLEPGWKHILVRPVPGGDFNSAKVNHDSPYGKIECSWQLDGGTSFKMSLQVPPNSKAYVVLPPGQSGIANTGDQSGTWVGSGFHTFACQIEKQAWPPEAIMPPFGPQANPVIA